MMNRNLRLLCSTTLSQNACVSKPQQLSDHGAASSPDGVCVVVLGMHRSATSLVTRLLSLMGLELPLTVMPPGFGNPAGFWEPQPVADANEALLGELGSAWDDWAPIDFKSDVIERHIPILASVLQKEFPGVAPGVLKDPRLCRLLRVWRPAFEKAGKRPLYILPTRNPLEVADSLARRNGFDRTNGILLWCAHVLDAERDTRSRPRAFLNIDDLYDHGIGALERVETFLREHTASIHGVEAESGRAFLRVQLKHENADFSAVSAQRDVPSLPARIYALLRQMALEGERSETLAALDICRAQFDTLATVAGHYRQRERQAADERDAARSEMDAAARRIDMLTQALSRIP
jgi:hypothetical protein